MKLRFRRWVAMLLLAAVGFAQASVSFAACTLERGRLAQVMAQADEAPCDSGTHFKQDGSQNANRCLAHCTEDLQLFGLPVVLVRGAVAAAVLVVPVTDQTRCPDTGLEAPAPGTPPPRILLHSFLI